jgi:hypothetical protein
VGRNFQHAAHFMRCDIVGAQMNAISSYSQRNVGAGID